MNAELNIVISGNNPLDNKSINDSVYEVNIQEEAQSENLQFHIKNIEFENQKDIFLYLTKEEATYVYNFIKSFVENK